MTPACSRIIRVEQASQNVPIGRCSVPALDNVARGFWATYEVEDDDEYMIATY